ncbi:MAG: glycoside hydrolase family 25 protein [Lewinellaceae bacterium]|nr:glycoside hydrolase family 25 protein [Lewinellaceae bacterium]
MLPPWRKLIIFPSDYASNKGTQPRDIFQVAILILAGLLIFSPEVRYKVFALITYPVHYKEYKEFGIRIPGGYQVHGIDVSRYQRQVDWDRVSKMQVGDIQIKFAFMKATEGSWLKDPQFNNNWKKAKQNKMIRGAYHYFLPNVRASDQAKNFIKTVQLRSGDLPPVVDIEETRGMSKAEVKRYTKVFLEILERQYRVKPILYTYRDFCKNYFADDPDFKEYFFWIAHFHVSKLNMPDDNNWHFWQHSDRGSVDGINERVDFNVFNGDSAALRKICLP